MTQGAGGGLCGGDEAMVREFLLHLNDRSRPLPTSLEYAIPVHLMALAADRSRLSTKVVSQEEF